MFPTELGTTFRIKCRIACLSTQNIFSGQLLIGLKNKDKNMLSITDWPGGMTFPETGHSTQKKPFGVVQESHKDQNVYNFRVTPLRKKRLTLHSTLVIFSCQRQNLGSYPLGVLLEWISHIFRGRCARLQGERGWWGEGCWSHPRTEEAATGVPVFGTCCSGMMCEIKIQF